MTYYPAPQQNIPPQPWLQETPRPKRHRPAVIISIFILSFLLAVLALVLALNNAGGHKSAHTKPACHGYCTSHDLEKSIKSTAQQRFDSRLGYGKVDSVFCVPERHLHYRCTVEVSVGGVKDNTVLNVTVSPNHQRWIS